MPIRGKVKVEGIIFCVDNDIELSRAETLLTKEEGTIAWLNKLQPGDVFYDIGANIGCYSLYAAKRGAKVYAFEPHLGNAHKLLMNVEVNGFGERIAVITSAVSNKEEFAYFYYRSKQTGSSGSLFRGGYRCDEFKPAAKEWKYGMSLDWFCRSTAVEKPNVVKIDVDGLEYSILLGMQYCLSTIRSVQVEVALDNSGRIERFMSQREFSLIERHHTLIGKKQLSKGIPEDKIVHNAVFERI